MRRSKTPGVSVDDLDRLLRGHATANIARALKVSRADIDDFISGAPVSAAMANRLGLTTDEAGELARIGKRSGTTGIVLGLLISRCVPA